MGKNSCPICECAENPCKNLTCPTNYECKTKDRNFTSKPYCLYNIQKGKLIIIYTSIYYL